MNITKLDDFDEGFKVAPRKAHRNPVKHDSKFSKGHGKTLAIMQDKLQKQSKVSLSEFDKPQAAKNAVLQLRFRGWQIEAIKDGRKAIGYKLIKPV